MAKSLTADRRNQIARILLNEGSIKVGELSRQFGVSTETIRKDIIYLEEKGLAEKSFGGAIAKSELIERSIDDKTAENLDKKEKIAKKAVQFIPEGGAVIIDAGSTNLAIAKILKNSENLTIFTNSLNIAQLLADTKNEVYFLGGRIRSSSKAAVGSWTEELLNGIFADVAFIGSDGFNGLAGPSAVSYSEADFKKKMTKAAKNVYTVADSTKFNNTGLFSYGKWQDVTGLITDDQAPKEAVRTMKEFTDVILAS